MIVLLMGAPGAGKGTQAELLAERLGYLKISTGDVLRSHIKNETEIGLLVKSIMAKGDLVSDQILMSILEQEFARAGSRDILLDGYPRNLGQARALEGTIKVPVRAAVHLDVPDEILISRLSGRRVCVSCASTFHISLLEIGRTEICGKCGGKLVQRPDDSEASVVHRLNVYNEQTAPMLERFKVTGSYRRVDGDGPTEVVFARIKEALQLVSA